MVRKRVTFPSKVKLLMYIDKYMVKKRVTFPSKFAYQYFINNISLSIYEPLGVSETNQLY
jgi:hypothetical protein